MCTDVRLRVDTYYQRYLVVIYCTVILGRVDSIVRGKVEPTKPRCWEAAGLDLLPPKFLFPSLPLLAPLQS
jgi:hypothetical protein